MDVQQARVVAAVERSPEVAFKIRFLKSKSLTVVEVLDQLCWGLTEFSKAMVRVGRILTAVEVKKTAQ